MEDVMFVHMWHVADGCCQIFALGVLDGHGGKATSWALRKVLPECIAYSLGNEADLNDTDWTHEINSKIMLAFWQAQ
ncbi:uncharacterized protein ACA1_371220 [Acanthamoeba castellanii str. Neff]|uniref:PPM-type phosphatase domain-containing protein n=1 Tax=Acanthamoeba castellanii (strain ATCC 30010 / Neff) TaxID=1257118 RepID=L8GZB2_ACACF|nr:uncharacterized protein ACA1_371220 [Acanthamoeba castellanii str. Neff]ELR18297.1 hypothetical protein ACA1_371220 [Acanthamoeba castellanii str. Neff]